MILCVLCICEGACVCVYGRICVCVCVYGRMCVCVFVTMCVWVDGVSGGSALSALFIRIYILDVYI